MKRHHRPTWGGAALLLASMTGCTLYGGNNLPVSQDDTALTTCQTIQHGVSGDTFDTQIASNRPRKNYGHMPVANAGTSGGGERQTLLRADLTAIPASVIIESATLTLWQNNTGSAMVNVHQVLAPWAENTVTWRSFDGAFAAEVAASASNGGPTHQGPIAFDLTALVQAWTSGESPNYGVLIEQAPGAATRFRTSKAGSSTRRPRLEICYTQAIPPEGTSLFMQVRDDAGEPISSAAVTVAGDLRATDGAGHILLEDLAPGRFAARVEARGYAPASVVVDLPEGAHTGIEVRLHPLGEPIPFDAAAGAVIEQGPVRVSIPAGALVDYKGEPVTGMVEATVVPLDPTTASVGELPGPLEAVTAETGEAVELESIAMAEVSLWQDGLPVHLASGATATLELPLPEAYADQYQVGDTIPAWWLDVDAGVWREEGAGTIQPASGNPEELIWVVEVSHFTWWNCDEPWTDKNCFQVTVVDENGSPVANTLVGADGVSYSGSSTPSYTGVEGQACVDIKFGSTADILIGSQFESLIPMQRVTGSGLASSCSGQGAACTPVTVMLLTGTVICTPGASQPCPYTGPTGTEGVGLCQAGTSYCNAAGTEWLGCQGEVLPAQETCATLFDDDCDGQANEPDDGQGCECGAGDTTSCYNGPPETLGVGICQAGERTCDTSIGRYGACIGEVLPRSETCMTPEDDDCDGQVNEPLGQVCICDGEVWEGDLSFEDPEDLETKGGYCGVTGDLSVNASVMTDWSALDNLQWVWGEVEIEDGTIDSSAFPALTTIGQDLEMEGISGSRWEGFSALLSIGGRISLDGVRLDALAGFPELRSVGGIDMIGADITDFSSFAPRLETIAGDFDIESSHIGILAGFNSLQTIDGSIWIGDTNVGTFSGFDSLRSLGNDFELSVSTLGTLSGFDALETVGGAIKIWAEIDELSGFNELTALNEFTLNGNEDMRIDRLSGFQSVGTITGQFVLTGTIGEISGFNGSGTIASITIDDAQIQTISGFHNVTDVGTILITDSDAAISGAFLSLQTISGDFIFPDSNVQIPDGFQALTSIEGDLHIGGDIDRDGPDVVVEGFDALEMIGGSLRIGSGTKIERIRGFRNLAFIGGSFDVLYNEGLRSLVGFNRLAEVGIGISMIGNQSLDTCYIDHLETTILANGYSGPFIRYDNGWDGGDECAELP